MKNILWNGTLNENELIIKNRLPEEVLETKIVDLACKHVFSIKTEQTKRIVEESYKNGYNARWGELSGDFSFEHQINKILKMEQDNYYHVIRIVRCNYSFMKESVLWGDNLHSLVFYLRKYGLDIKLKDIPFYLIDISDGQRIIYNYNDNLRKNMDDIKGAVRCALTRQLRSDNQEIIKLNYKIKDFIKDNPEFITYKKEVI